jgi:kumamolisin
VPDVAADVAGSTGYFMVSQGNPEVFGGTGAAAPLWAALLARLWSLAESLRAIHKRNRFRPLN